MQAPRLMFQDLENRGRAAVEQWIEDGAEHLHLDFKQKSDRATVDPGTDDLRNYSKALSGFANAAGGLLVWGVAERRRPEAGEKPFAPDPLSAPDRFAQQLDHLHPMMVARPVDGVRNIPVDGGYVVTLVPESSQAPHRAEAKGEKRHYKRVGSNFVVMEQYEIEDMFGRRQRPDLRVLLEYQKMPASDGNVHLYKLKAELENQGRAMARFYKVRVLLPKAVIGWPSHTNKPNGSGEFLYISDPASPLFPGERIKLSFDGTTYHMTHDLYFKYHEIGWPDVIAEVYTDGLAPSRVTRSFNELFENF